MRWMSEMGSQGKERWVAGRGHRPSPPPLPLPASSRRPVHLFRSVPVLRRHDAALLSSSSVLPVSVGATRTILGFREPEAAWIAITVSLDLSLMLVQRAGGQRQGPGEPRQQPRPTSASSGVARPLDIACKLGAIILHSMLGFHSAAFSLLSRLPHALYSRIVPSDHR